MTPGKGKASQATPICHECHMGAPSGTFVWDRHTARLYLWCWSCSRALRLERVVTAEDRRQLLEDAAHEDAPDQGAWS